MPRQVKSNWWDWIVTGPSNEGKLGPAVQGNYNNYLRGYADIAWVFKCVQAIAVNAASVPIKLYRGKGDDKKEVVSHVVLDMLNYVNDYSTLYDLKEITFSNMEITGNMYWLITKNALKTPRQIFPLRPDRVEIVPDKENYILGYIYTVNGKRISYTADEVIHFKYFNPTDDYYGLSQLSAIRTHADTEDYASRYNRNFFKNSARVDATLETEQELDDQAYKRLRADWLAAHQGEGKEHGISILEKGLKYNPIAISQKDMDFLNLMKLTRETICGIMGVKPAVVGLFEYANYANAEMQYKMFWQDTEMPKIAKYVGTLNEFVLPMFNDKSLYFEADYSGVEALRENEVQKKDIDMGLVQSGIETINERRAKRGLMPVAWGDAWWAPFSLAPVTSAEPKPEALPTEPAPTATEPAKAAKTKLSDSLKQRKWDLFIKGLTHFEDKLKPVLRRLFNDQEQEVLAKLDRQKAVEKRINVDSVLFDLKDEVAKFRKNGKPILTDMVAAAGNEELALLSIGIAFDITNPRVTAFLERKAMTFAQEVNETTIKKLKKTLIEGIEAGEGIPDLSKRVSTVFDEATTSRTIMIARTETISASNFGALESYKQSGIVTKKGWITARDRRVRDSHQIDGQEVNLDDNFTLADGTQTQYPGGSGVPEDDIQCRCTVYGVTKED